MIKPLLTAIGLLLSISVLAATDNTNILLTTSEGNIELELDNQRAPMTVKNFVNYVNKSFYNGTFFHRVIPGFMIQGGGFSDGMQQKSGDAPVKNETGNGLLNRRGTIAMARMADKDSATSQFFINLVDNPFLDRSQNEAGYTVFGPVVKGMKIIDKISQVPTHQVGPYQDVPVQPVVLLSVCII